MGAAISSNMAAPYKTLFMIRNLTNLTNMAELYPFLESKSGICYLRGFVVT